MNSFDALFCLIDHSQQIFPAISQFPVSVQVWHTLQHKVFKIVILNMLG